jgi:hypothetical protein
MTIATVSAGQKHGVLLDTLRASGRARKLFLGAGLSYSALNSQEPRVYMVMLFGWILIRRYKAFCSVLDLDRTTTFALSNNTSTLPHAQLVHQPFQQRKRGSIPSKSLLDASKFLFTNPGS